MRIGVPAETRAGETRVAITPETAKKLKAQGHTLFVQSGAGLAASVTDTAYEAMGVQITDAAGAQIGHDHAATTVGLRAVERTGVVEQSMIARLRDHAQTLTDIQYGQTQHTLR